MHTSVCPARCVPYALALPRAPVRAAERPRRSSHLLVGRHYLHSGERNDRNPVLPGVRGASLSSYLRELRNCSRHLRARYARAVHVYKLSNWVRVPLNLRLSPKA